MMTDTSHHSFSYSTHAGSRQTACRLFCWACALPLLLTSCHSKHRSITPAERRAADSIVARVHTTDSLAMLQQALEADGQQLASIVALRQWGKALREESRFDEALRVHNKGLQQAEALGDTLEWVMALNHIGTNYRRLGILDVAQEYHYRALKLSEACADTSFEARKNYVKSLNGLGNIYMSIGNYQRADSVLRLALAGEQTLGSNLGQAIDCANIASVCKARGQRDSAWVYYRRSMAFNRADNNVLGVSLCHTYFGSLYEEARQYEQAYAEYRQAYELMKHSKDEWHALESLLALAHIDYTTGNDARALQQLEQAKVTAERIKAKEHLAEIHQLYYLLYRKQGDYRSALTHHVQASALQDSVVDMEKMNRIQNVSIRIERHQQTEKVAQVEQELAAERAQKAGILYTGLLALVVLGAVVGFLVYLGRMRRRNHLLLKKVSALREHFFTNITHEFRTPLTLILGLSGEMAEDEEVSDSVRKKSRTIERQGRNLLTLINQLLDISKMKSAVGDPDWRSGDIAVQIGMVIEGYREYTRSRNIVLQYLPQEKVVMDFVPDYINKVMNNLLSNALKFTPEYGRVDVTLGRDADCLRLTVADTGKGMAQECIEHVFEPFYQAESDVKHIGTGVGLALVKQIIDSLGGTIRVESCEGKGTTFIVSLPIRHDKHRAATFDASENGAAAVALVNDADSPTLPNPTSTDKDLPQLLIIEDNHDVAMYIGAQLEDRYAVAYADNGSSGLEQAIRAVPDLVITDLMMPGMNGLEVCKQLRANEITNHIPVIILTAKMTESDRVQGIEAGADAYLAKPFNHHELRTRVEKLLAQRRLLREKYTQQAIRQHEEELQQSENDRRFLTKLTDCVYLLINREREVDVKQVAAQMHMSYSQLYRKLSALTGCTPMAFIQRVKIRRACFQLDRHPELSLSEVADKCGFSDYSNFVRAFKNVCGVTPTQYIRERDGKEERK